MRQLDPLRAETLLDAQRMLNFNASTDVQVNALQPKSPWLAPMRAIEGEAGAQWKSGNIDAYAVMFWNDYDDEAPEGAQAIQKPERGRSYARAGGPGWGDNDAPS